MSGFCHVFSISVEHSFFVDGAVRGVEFYASPGTASMFASVGVVMKRAVSGIDILCEESRLKALRLYSKDGSDLVDFSFSARITDQEFFAYTDSGVFPGNQLLFFKNEKSDSASVTKRDVVSEDDLHDLDPLIKRGVLSASDKRRLPHFVIALEIPVEVENEARSSDFCIRFGARSSFWKYYLLGKMNRESVRIVDVDNRVEFKSCGELMLPGNRRSQVFISTARIPISEKSPYRFQLRETDRQGDRILVRRLPVASVTKLGSEVVDGKREVVFENYVNF